MRSSSSAGFHGVNPVTGEELEPEYFDACPRDIDAAVTAATSAAEIMRALPAVTIRSLMEAIAAALERRREAITARCQLETGYPPERVAGEFGRMVDGMRQFGRVAEAGDWLDVRIDRADPSRRPLPKPDLRRMNVPIGPVVVFGASNFPLALSVAGSDVASALAAACPVVVKGHPSHPGTSELLARAIEQAVAATGFPGGTFSMVHGASNAVGQALVEHPGIRAIAFTGSLAGGRAIFDLAARREVPIPVYAEMGSVNPQFVFPDLLAKDAEAFARRLFAAATMGNGQFCTNPGVVFLGGDAASFIEAYRAELSSHPGAALLNAGIKRSFDLGVAKWRAIPGLQMIGEPQAAASDEKIGTAAVAAMIDLDSFLGSATLFHEEVFGRRLCWSIVDPLRSF